MNARLEALAYRVWAYCEPLGWNCTHIQVAEALDVHYNSIAAVCARKGWGDRLRVTKGTPLRNERRNGAPSHISPDMRLPSGEALF